MKRILLLGSALLAVSLGISAQKAMKAPAGGKAISDELTSAAVLTVASMPS